MQPASRQRPARDRGRSSGAAPAPALASAGPRAGSRGSTRTSIRPPRPAAAGRRVAAVLQRTSRAPRACCRSSLEPVQPARSPAADEPARPARPATKKSACRCRIASASPLASSRSSPNSRTVSSMRKRGSPPAPPPAAAGSCPPETRPRRRRRARTRPDRCDGLRGLQREAADEDREPAEEALLLGCQQVVAPGDGIAHRLLPRRQVARASGQQRQPVLKSREQRCGREHLDPRRGQLDGQRQPVQSAADLGNDRRRSASVSAKSGLTACARVDEEAHSRGLRRRLPTSGGRSAVRAAPAAAPGIRAPQRGAAGPGW